MMNGQWLPVNMQWPVTTDRWMKDSDTYKYIIYGMACELTNYNNNYRFTGP